MEMPEEMRKALYGASSTDEKRDPFMEAIAAVPNPWVAPREGEVRIPYEGEDDEERKFSEVHEPLERIFRGVPDTVTSEPAEGRFRFSKNPSAPADQPLEKRAIAAWSREFLSRTLGDEQLTSRREQAAREYFLKQKEEGNDYSALDAAAISEEDGDLEDAAMFRRVAEFCK